MCKNLTEIVDGSYHSYPDYVEKNLVMVLRQIELSFKCHDGIRIPYAEKDFGACKTGLTYMTLAHKWKKRTLGEGPYVRRV